MFIKYSLCTKKHVYLILRRNISSSLQNYPDVGTVIIFPSQEKNNLACCQCGALHISSLILQPTHTSNKLPCFLEYYRYHYHFCGFMAVILDLESTVNNYRRPISYFLFSKSHNLEALPYLCLQAYHYCFYTFFYPIFKNFITVYNELMFKVA